MLFFVSNVYANEDLDITGTAVILLERSTGRVLYGRNIDGLVYPASMIKVLTSIVLLDHMDIDDIIRVGREIYYVPAGSSRAGHVYAENITGLNILRGLILPSGNDTANVAVAHVARAVSGTTLPFPEAEALFANLMNERAREIGATNSNFTNAHGFHDPEMRVTVRDLAIIAEYALDIPIIAEVAMELNYQGSSWPDAPANVRTTNFNWNNTNRLLVGEFYNPDVIGLKTGFHTPAGWTFIGAARRGNMELVSVIAGSYAETRWHDTTALFNYGFETYAMRPVHVGSSVIEEISIQNPRWGYQDTTQVRGTANFIHLLSQAELNAIERELVFFDEFVYTPYYTYYDQYDGATNDVSFVAPLYAGYVIGEVIYTLNGQELFRDNIVIQEDIPEWTRLSSLQYAINYLIENPFSIFGLSFILGVIFLLIIIVQVVGIVLRIRRRKRKGLRGYSVPRFKYR